MVSNLASLVSAPNGVTVFDPVAGDGSAVAGLLASWADAGVWGFSAYGCEMEATRAAALANRLGQAYAFHADAFRLQWSEDSATDVLYLNPPYDGPANDRLELRFLRRFTPLLAPDGVLLFVVPYTILGACASYLDAHYIDLSCYAFPAPHFDLYRQCVLVGRRSRGGLPGGAAPHVAAIGAGETAMRPLPAPGAVEPLEVAGTGDLYLSLAKADVRGDAEAHRPFAGNPDAATNLSLDEMIGRVYPTAMPPKPAHIALAVGAGHLNGRKVARPAGSDLPPVLMKGVHRRTFVETGVTRNEDGVIQSSTQVERPELQLSVLDLDTYTFHDPALSAEPTGAHQIGDMNAADLLTAYAGPIGSVMEKQFPPLHDPRNPSHAMTLPSAADRGSDREPYRCQAHAVQTMLKVLGAGRNPPLLAEVGTGKTTMALIALAALSPNHHRATVQSLSATGAESRHLPLVRRSLIVCPPHLANTWQAEAQIVWPHARTVFVNSISDLDQEGEIYILTRERAKLGARIQGISGTRCPRCGAQLTTNVADRGRKRQRCEHVHRSPSNVFAELAIDLATRGLRQSSERKTTLRHTVP